MLAKIYYYQNFTIPETLGSLDVLVWAMCAGIILAVTYATFDRFFCQKMVKALLERGAQTEDTALTLDSLEIGGKWYLKGALKEGKPLRKMLMVPQTQAAPASAASTPFYLPEEKRYQAETRFNPGRAPFRTLILCIIALVATALFVQFIVPELLTMLDNLVGMIKNG